ncbi:BatD family protein [Arcobacter sp. LA11]|uniref:BatD family protein n=1 Tax=Arcobacter sp. LA11 TaxID=1898176 RepID=UPI0009332817|nr:BatD family protein [Arcobacter sp. LA11]
MKQVRFLFICIFFNIYLFADLNMQAPDSFVKGESYIFKYEAIGSSIDFPKIEKIDRYLVEDLGTSRSLQIINGNYDEKYSKTYKIAPTDDFTIPSFTFMINGKEVKSNEKRVTVQKVTKTTSSKFDLSLKPSKTSLYVGEDLLVKLVFKYRRGLQITNLGFEQPHFENFWYKKITNGNRRYEENGFIVQELEFLLFPQKSGELTIDSLRVDVQLVDTNSSSNTFGFFSAIPKVVKVYSNELKLNVKELPKDINLIGEFDIETNINKTKVKQGESISFKVDINGVGNFDDIQDIKLNIDEATIYDNKPEIKTKYSSKGYEGTYSKVYSIVPNKSIEIPSISFKYFNKKDKKIVEKKTKSYKIEVEDFKEKKVVLEKAEKEIETKKEVIIKKESSFQEKLTFFILGIIVTLLIIGLYSYVKILKSKKRNDDIPLIKLVKKTSTKQELMKLLIPYIKSNTILDELIYQCESEKDFKILKKEIIEVLKEIKI